MFIPLFSMFSDQFREMVILCSIYLTGYPVKYPVGAKLNARDPFFDIRQDIKKILDIRSILIFE